MTANTRDIVFTRYDGRRGIGWLRESYRMFSRHRLGWISMLAGYYIALLVVDVVPFIGVFIAPMLKPVLSVGFLAAALYLLKGCPMCWTLGLIETIAMTIHRHSERQFESEGRGERQMKRTVGIKA